MSQELIDDANGGYLIPGQFVREIFASIEFEHEYPGVKKYVVAPRLGWRAWWYRLWHRETQDYPGWEHRPTPEWAAFLEKFRLEWE